jgi:hypothetical protein
MERGESIGGSLFTQHIQLTTGKHGAFAGWTFANHVWIQVPARGKLFHSKQDYFCLKAVEVGALSTAKGVSPTSIAGRARDLNLVKKMLYCLSYLPG